MTWLDGPLLALKLETTGRTNDGLLPVAFGLVWFDGGEVVKQRTGLINPGVPIHAQDSQAHGITDAMVQEKGGDLWRSVDGIFQFMREAALAQAPLIGIELRYELTMLDSLLRQSHEGKGMRDLGWDGIVLDAHTLDRSLDAFRKGDRHPIALCRHYGVGGGTHQPAADCIAAFRVLTRIAQLNPTILEESLSDLFVQEQLAHKEWVQSYSRWRVKKGRTPLEEEEADWPLPGDTIRVRGGAPKESDLLVTDGQRTSLIMRMKEVTGVDERAERLWLLAQMTGRPVLSFNQVTQGEYHSVVAFLKSIEGTATPNGLAREARAQVAKGYTPEAAFEAAEGPVDVTDVPKEILASTMQKIMMEWKGAEVSQALRRFSQPDTGSVKERKLRLYEFCIRERAAGNEEVEALFA